MRQRLYILIPLIALAACDLFGPSTLTTVSGAVYMDGVGIEGVTVRLIASTDAPPWCCQSVGSAVTDAEGRFSVSGEAPEGSDRCSIHGVDVDRVSERGVRLLSDRPDPRLFGVECGTSQTGFDFRFYRDLWYLGVDLVADTLEVSLGEVFRLAPTFRVSRSFQSGAIHADSFPDWIWVGEEAWEFAFDDSLFWDVTDYTSDWYYGGMNFIDLEAREVGRAAAVAIATPTSQADTVHIAVRPGRAVGDGPSGITASPDGSFVAFVERDSDRLSWFSTADGSTMGTVSIRNGLTATSGRAPVDVAITPDGQRAFVANLESANVSIVDLTTAARLRSPGVDAEPSTVAITSDGSRVYVANRGDATVSILDTQTDTVVAELEVGLEPVGIAISPDRGLVYVAEIGSGNVRVIDDTLGVVVDAIPVGGGPHGIAVSADGTFALVTKSGSDEVAVIDVATRRVRSTIGVGSVPLGVAIMEDGSRAYVTNSGSGTVSVVDLTTEAVVASVEVGDGPYGIALVESTSRAYVTNQDSNDVYTIDLVTNTVVR